MAAAEAVDEASEQLYNPFAWSTRGINWARDFPPFLARGKAATDLARAELKTEVLHYGASTEQRIEWFRVDDQPRPIFVFIHGGGWRAGDVASSGFMAGFLAKEGIETAVLGYDLCPRVGLETIVAEVRRGFQALLDAAPPTAPLCVCGVSAGAHLAATLLGAAEGRTGAFFLLSGIYDLRPLVRLGMAVDFLIDSAAAERISPLCGDTVRTAASVTLVVGGAESPAFRAQAARMAERLRAAGCPRVEVREEEGLDHLHMNQLLETPDTVLWESMLAAMRPQHGD